MLKIGPGINPVSRNRVTPSNLEIHAIPGPLRAIRERSRVIPELYRPGVAKESTHSGMLILDAMTVQNGIEPKSRPGRTAGEERHVAHQ
jgi:hypothetical protein